MFLGSSPLARGLRNRVIGVIRQIRIIPARAGFTTVECDAIAVRQGSSPLARGLLKKNSAAASPVGIIPARAGFTATTQITMQAVADHPRSRGVYSTPAIRSRCSAGSSPLARGLPILQQTNQLIHRIIPARAGFTLGDRRDSNGGPPYQGAFAFTGDLGTARLSCGSVVAGQRSTTTPSPV